MTIERYRLLIGQLCATFNVPDPEGMYQSASLRVDDIKFTFFHGGLMMPDSVLMYCDFGTLPTDAREHILLRLLETNMYLFGLYSPAFTYDTQRNRIVMMCRFPLQQADLESTLELLHFFSGVARRWRRDHFLFD